MTQSSMNKIKKSLDVVIMLLMLLLMSYQVTGEAIHEWTGITSTILVIFHQILNRKWYQAFFKGRYNPYRIVTTVINLLLLASFLFTAFCGMSMSAHAVPFMYGLLPVSFSRKMHLAMSFWSFILMGLHLGMHIPLITAGLELSSKIKTSATGIFAVVGGIGLCLFLKANIVEYIFFRTHFAFLDYEKATVLVLIENLTILLFFAFLGDQAANLMRSITGNKGNSEKASKRNSLVPVVWILASIVIGLVVYIAMGNADKKNGNATGWSPDVTTTAVTYTETSSMSEINNTTTEVVNNQKDPASVNDGYVLISAGVFEMGSPESENWRIDDEMLHKVALSAFYIDPYETTQKDYLELMGTNPSTFEGEDLPVDSISWMDAILYANAKSESMGLTPVYSFTEEGVVWDRSANGYRLPTEAEWEYACRAGTRTPFNTEKSLSADEANFYGHYPYEIEENYFNDSVLEARPGEYRQTTIAVGSFQPNAWGLYDCHGNINEWCWDYYGEYEAADQKDPTGSMSGTRHVYRGGGWNDFAKNMRSAYRAAGQSDLKSYNLGVRLVRNASLNMNGSVIAKEKTTPASDRNSNAKILIVYFSWGGNTRGIANEIERQTGADIFEITLVEPYSTDYNTVLMQAQEDQHNQARPKIKNKIENIDQYDTIILGYPNWWASIPMPIATFLEEYDLSGKTIIPFCSHGGGRFGQSLTAIAKLAPDSIMGEGLSVHYSGGSTLSSDVKKWLEENGI